MVLEGQGSNARTASGKHADVDIARVAHVNEVQRANDIAADRLLLVVLAPVDVWAARHAGAVEDVGGLDLVDFSLEGLAVFHAHGGGVDFLALGLEHVVERLRDPAVAADDHPALVFHVCGHCVLEIGFECWLCWCERCSEDGVQ